jgi:hypothetical protein
METRPLFVLGDFAANIFVATAITAVTSLLIGGSLGMWPGMIAGMLLGMALALPLGFGLMAPWLGVMEVATPTMLSGMFAGMWGGMWDLSAAEMLRWGAGTGVAVVVVIYALNAVMSGPQRVEG